VDVRELKSGAGDVSKEIAPKGAIQIKNDAGTTGFVGPCPPPGAPHEYLITVYALKSKLEVDQNATAAYVGFNLHFQVLEKASIVMYGKR
jgi:Raf kinase inhibitor-like YbhB/YbcL family protein